MRLLRDRLQDILEATTLIEAEQAKGKGAFDASPLMQVGMVHHLMIIGEAVRAIDPAMRQKYPEVPWRQIAGDEKHSMITSGLTTKLFWETVGKHIPPLKARLEAILASLPPE